MQCQWVIIRSVFDADKISVYKLDIQNIKKCFLDYWNCFLPEITKQLHTSKLRLSLAIIIEHIATIWTRNYISNESDLDNVKRL